MSNCICGCPREATLESIPVRLCKERFGQTQRAMFQRLRNDDNERQYMTLAEAILLATWAALLTAGDSTKVVITPIFAEPTAEPGDAITYGGGNATPDGVEYYMGSNPTPFTAIFHDTSQEVIAAMKKMICEDPGLGVALINNCGAIALKKETVTIAGTTSGGSTTEDRYYFFPIMSFFVSDKGLGGLEEPDVNNLGWSFRPNWSDGFTIIQPDFNALYDLDGAVTA